jgi:lysophospholipase L1-like esterase
VGLRRDHLHRSSNFIAAGLAGTALFTVNCTTPSQPTKTVIIPPPAIACPASPAVATSTNGLAVPVSYGVPTVSGGTTPVTTACTPPSGSAFNLGTTSVTCIATDAVRRAAGCTFPVTVSLPAPHLGVTRILAFGDSITEGEVPLPSEFGLQVRIVMPERSYPADLTTLLAQRYTAQGALRVDAFTFNPNTDVTNCSLDQAAPTTSGIVVVNAGCLGATASDGVTGSRLADKIGFYNPDLLLLHIGVNDLDPTSPTTSISHALLGVQSLITYARSKGVRVMVGTLVPEIPGLPRAGAANLIPPFNNQLVGVAASAGATLVDLYSDINTDLTDWISPYDGLHPTAAGYQEIARVWFNAIKSAYELPTSTTTAVPVRLKPNATHFSSVVPGP